MRLLTCKLRESFCISWWSRPSCGSAGRSRKEHIERKFCFWKERTKFVWNDSTAVSAEKHLLSIQAGSLPAGALGAVNASVVVVTKAVW